MVCHHTNQSISQSEFIYVKRKNNTTQIAIPNQEVATSISKRKTFVFKYLIQAFIWTYIYSYKHTYK